MEPVSPWVLAGTTAVLECAALGLTVDVDRPSQGMRDIQVDGESWSDCQLLAINLPGSTLTEPIADHYVRGNDLVVTFLQTPDRTVRPQLYWRALQSPLSGVDLVVSMQTSLLASQPGISIGSTLFECAVYRFDGSSFHEVNETQICESSLVLFRPRGLGFTYAELIHPTDCEQLRIEIDGKIARSQFELFHHELEKGVIRRGRLRSVFLPRARDHELAADLLASFENSEAPLTT